ncbi:hypothetical protein [Clostridium sp.]|uniref:hypothetical protein n=1 Tax=Clostridium sp. TaxID=1506 RepID=UPI002620DCB1|nr:hypothetical protein [uncultured Clostridium sp.]
MIIRSIKDSDIFKIMDENDLSIHYGCNQEWYTNPWQRNAGCGPTAVTNIMIYLNCMRKGLSKGKQLLSKSEALSMMEEVWLYVTPTNRGIPTTKLLYDDVINYAKAKKLNIKLELMDIHENRLLCPEFHNLLLFLGNALSSDAPIAFLNLDNGEEKQLDSWHWVTIVSLKYVEDESNAFIDILDEGIIKKIDLVKWLNTTTLGGGFVSVDLLI